MEKNLVTVLEDVKKKVEKFHTGKKKDKYVQDLTSLVIEYGKLDVQERHQETYNSLVKRGNELLKESNIKDIKKLEYYLRYCNAALFDFNDNLQPLNWILKSFLLSSMLFFILTPQYFGFILPFIFVIPVFMGLRGMKKRTLNGLITACAIVPMGIMTGTIWLKNAYMTMGNFSAFINGLAQHYNMSFVFAKNLAIACIFLSAVLVVSSVLTAYFGIRFRKMFI